MKPSAARREAGIGAAKKTGRTCSRIRDVGGLARRIQDLDATCARHSPESVHDGGAACLLRHPVLIEKSRCRSDGSFRQGGAESTSSVVVVCSAKALNKRAS